MTETPVLLGTPSDAELTTELGTRPRTTYLAHLSNPNPKIPRAKTESEDEHTHVGAIKDDA